MRKMDIWAIDKYEILVHTLGSDNPGRWYRNHFVAGPKHHDIKKLNALCQDGLMRCDCGPSFMPKDQKMFRVTEAGKQYCREIFKEGIEEI